MIDDQEKRPGFDDPVIRGSASDVRRQAFLERRQASDRMVFVSRVPSPAKGFHWEIRRFGGIVLKTSEVDYETIAAAQVAGEEEFARWLS